MSNRALLRFIALPSTVPALLAAALLGQATPVFAANTLNIDVPIGETVVNPCAPPDTFTYASFDHIVASFTMDSNGGVHITSVSHSYDSHSVEPAFPSGSNYVEKDTMIDSINENSGGTDEFTVVDKLYYISQGRVPNFYLDFFMHITFAHGVFTATPGDSDTSC
ncbi:MAG: hypothetical protein E6I21_05830 [Chloroflexi bacterium]|nr:MAG: hypothetical protein E6I21_05830 [Chloroflexota bacterium]